MKRLAFLSVLVLLAISAGVNLSSARSATPASALLDALPDGTAVAVIDFQKVAGSNLWATLNAQDRLKSEIDKAQSEMANLGLTLRDVHTVALVFSGTGFNSPTVALSGGFEQNNLLGRLRASSKLKLSSEKYKGVDIYKASAIGAPVRSNGDTAPSAALSDLAKDQTSFVFHDSTTVVVGSPEAVRASVDVKAGARPGLAQNSQLSTALAQNPAAAIRFAFALTPAMTNGLKSGNLPVDFSTITLVFGTIDVGSGVEFDATLRSDNAEHAKSLSERLNALLTVASSLVGSMGDTKMTVIAEALKTVSIVSADTDVKITGSLPMALLESLIPSSTKK